MTPLEVGEPISERQLQWACIGCHLRWIAGRHDDEVISHAVVANLLFFALSNLGFWYGNPALAQTGAGLFTAYVEALPFFVSATASTLVYGALLQWAYAKRSVLGMA